MEVISAIGLSLAALREVCRLCSAVDGDNDAAWTESTICLGHGRHQGVDPGEQRADSFHPMCMLLVSQDMKVDTVKPQKM